MLVTVTNTAGFSLNVLAAITGGVGPSSINATGGSVSYPLPYPFAHIGELAASGTKQLSMHVRDWRYKRHICSTHDAGEQWQMMVNAGLVTLAVASESTSKDKEDAFISAV